MTGTTDVQLHWVQSLDEAWAMKRWLGERRPGGWLSIDTESTGLDYWRDRLRTVQFGDRHHGWTMEWADWGGLIKECTSAYDGPIAMHNAKHDVHFMRHNGIPLKPWLIHDTRAMAHILNPHERSGLKPTAEKILGPWALYGERELKTAMTRGGYDYATIPTELEWEYAAFDTVITAQIAEELYPRVMNGYAGIYDLELASTQVLGDMETRGIKTDLRYLRERVAEWGQEMEFYALQLRNFGVANPNSDVQIVRMLQDKIGWRPLVFTDSGRPKLGDGILSAIEYEGAQLAAAWREAHMLQTYALQHIEFTDPVTGRLHGNINPLGARTGRTSATRPNMQNLPSAEGGPKANGVRIRNGFLAEDRYALISADYDQIEARLFAHFSEDEMMLKAIRYGDMMTAAGHDGYDVHSMAARIVYSIGLDTAVPKPVRKKIKNISFGKIFGSGLEKFCAMSGQSLEEGAHSIALYEAAFPQTAKSGFQHRITKRLYERERSEGEAYVKTAYGRKEPCWPSQAYKAVNYLCQGTAADVIKSQMVALSKTWVGEYMLLTIHDELIFEVPEEVVHEAIPMIEKTMAETERFAVPLLVGAKSARRWGDFYLQDAA